jgi:hypothetical protein
MFVHARVHEPSAKTLRITVWLAITAVVAVALLAATGASRTALAATSIHQSLPISVNSTSYAGSDEDCAKFDLDAGEAMWHFVLTQTTAGVGTLLNVQFDNGAWQQVAATRKTGGTLHWYVFTSGKNALTGASTAANGGRLNLSHICSGGTSSSSSSSSSSSNSSGSSSSSGSSTR